MKLFVCDCTMTKCRQHSLATEEPAFPSSSNQSPIRRTRTVVRAASRRRRNGKAKCEINLKYLREEKKREV